MVKKKLIIFMPSIEDGGVEKNLYLISNYLSIKINPITLITFNNDQNKKFNSNIKIKTPLFNPSFIKGRYLKYFFCLLVLLKLTIFDKKNIVLSFQANIFVIIVCKFLNLKIISRSNSSSAGWSNNFFKQSIFKIFFKKADKIIVNSYEFKKEMDKKYKINCACILNPFNFSEIKKKSNSKISIIFNKKNIKLISVGRITDQKDFLTILKALNIVRKNNVELVIIGKGEKEIEIKRFIELNNLKKKVKLLGYKKNPFPYIKQADLFLLTSKFEGLPNVLIEALFLKKFIISTNCPTGPKEILNNGKFGELVKIGDYKKIAKLIDNFKKNKIVKKKIRNGYMSLKKYNYKVNCEKYYQLIKYYL